MSRRLAHGGSGALLLIDLDGFKAINDTAGHLAGDQVLASVAAAVSEVVRAEDFVARVGGDEFVVVLGRADARDVCAVAEKLDRAVEAAPRPRGVGDLRASIGSAVFTRGGDLETLMRRADREMYADKARHPARV